MNLRKKVPLNEFLRRNSFSEKETSNSREKINQETEEILIDEKAKAKLKEISNKIDGSGKAVLLNNDLNEIRTISARTLTGSLNRIDAKISVIVMDGSVTSSIISAAEEVGCQVIVAKNFYATSNKLKLLSL